MFQCLSVGFSVFHSDTSVTFILLSRCFSVFHPGFSCQSLASLSRCYIGWLRLVGSLTLYVSFAEYSLFYRALLQKRPIILRSLLIVTTTYQTLVFKSCVSFFCLGVRWVNLLLWWVSYHWLQIAVAPIFPPLLLLPPLQILCSCTHANTRTRTNTHVDTQTQK